MTKMLMAVDTATDNFGLALVADGRIQAELSLATGETHTKHILTAIDTVSGLAGVTLDRIDAFAVTRGPGSFTGLRIGISTMKGIAFAMGKPLIGVSSLEVLANQAGEDAQMVCPVIDARRNEIYWCVYRRTADGLVAHGGEHVGSAGQLAAQIDDACLFVGSLPPQHIDDLYQLVMHDVRWAHKATAGIRPSILAGLAWQRFLDDRTGDAETLLPVYLRKSDAEIKADINPGKIR